MNYLESNEWVIKEMLEIKYISNDFSLMGKAAYSVQKTYEEGIDIIRSIHVSNEKYHLISTTESRSSGPSEADEGRFEDLEGAKEALVSVCKEDDNYYK